MKTNEISIDNALKNNYSLHLCCASGKVTISYYDEDGEKHSGECNDTISYDRYNELCNDDDDEEQEQELLDLYKYFINLCD